MGDEDKSFEASQQKLKKARDNGQVIKSKDLSTALFIVVMFILLLLLAPAVFNVLGETFVLFFQQIPNKHLDDITWQYMMTITVRALILVVAPFLMVALFIAVVADFIQVGPLLTFKPIFPKIDKLNPIKGFQNIFSKRSLVELVKNILKISLLALLAYVVFQGHVGELIAVGATENIFSILYILGEVLGQFIFMAGVAFFLIGGGDYLYQRNKFMNDQKMSMKEMKDEYKQSEGDPMVKAQLRQKRMQMLMQRMLEAVPEADAIITNPIHYAVAVKYEAEAMEAPRVVAKGTELFAKKIKDIAEENDVPIIENVVVAQTLYKLVDIDRDIPADLYQAVAEILMTAWQISGKSLPGRPAE